MTKTELKEEREISEKIQKRYWEEVLSWALKETGITYEGWSKKHSDEDIIHMTNNLRTIIGKKELLKIIK